MTAVRISGIVKHYRAGFGLVEALRGIDLDVASGESVAVMGPSGCGKSTLLGLIAGLEPPTAGTIVVGDTEITALDDAARTAFRREAVGLIFQSADLIPFLTAVENVDLPLALLGRSDPDRAREILAALGLGSHIDKLPDQLSGGQRQRVGIARALVHEPRLILADEPTGELDSAASAAAMDLLQQIHRDRGATLIVVTHDRAVAGRLDRIVRLSDGLVRAEGAPIAAVRTANAFV
ncbi:MAG TPA: ABC transporter ATP-binding protein [Candidatus Limnocylindria bacterium]|nr:ABC transporter ATP-binding protein [Candidatus Limnocylindria bacterium]